VFGIILLESMDMLSYGSNVTLPIRELDLFLGELCASGVPVNYIPGLHDPTNANWPQKPEGTACVFVT
jgi:hypothetical protein